MLTTLENIGGLAHQWEILREIARKFSMQTCQEFTWKFVWNYQAIYKTNFVFYLTNFLSLSILQNRYSVLLADRLT